MYNYFEATQIKPKGWLLKQLQIQAKGLSGNLDKMWPDVRDSAWIGGNREGWERVPYWLDGFIPLAYLLQDNDMIERADKYIISIIEHQQPDGWICPCSDEERKTYDIWAHFLICKVLALYCDFTKCKKPETALYRAMRCLYNMMSENEIVLSDWGKYRWYECFIPLEFLYEKYNEEWLLELGRILKLQGANYSSFTNLWKKPMNKWTHETHIVNLAMMLKYEAVSCKLLGDKYTNVAEELWNILEEYNGTVVGTFTGDECLSGIANNQGTELCSVIELMYTCELLYAITGDIKWADRLEKIAYNALPATMSEDMWTHQYVQQVNQIACIKFSGKPIFRTNNKEAHLFGLEPHFGCCTANHNQGWPKLTMSIYLKTDKGISCSLMLPSQLKTIINDSNITITNETEYPFKHFCKYIVNVDKPVEFELKIRIPNWAKNVRVNNQVANIINGYIVIDKKWQGEEVVTIDMEDIPHLVDCNYGLKAAAYGPLVFALPIDTEYKMYEYEKDGVERKFPYCDYEFYPKSEWRYGFENMEFDVVEQVNDEVPFSTKKPKVYLKAKLARVDWDYEEGYDTVANKIPNSNIPLSSSEEKTLIPYGCAKLRITEMPIVKSK